MVYLWAGRTPLHGHSDHWSHRPGQYVEAHAELSTCVRRRSMSWRRVRRAGQVAHLKEVDFDEQPRRLAALVLPTACYAEHHRERHLQHQAASNGRAWSGITRRSDRPAPGSHCFAAPAPPSTPCVRRPQPGRARLTVFDQRIRPGRNGDHAAQAAAPARSVKRATRDGGTNLAELLHSYGAGRWS